MGLLQVNISLHRQGPRLCNRIRLCGVIGSKGESDVADNWTVTPEEDVKTD